MALSYATIERATGVFVIEERGRTLAAHDVTDVLDVPVLARIHAREQTAHAVDAGVLVSRMPDVLSKPLRHALVHAGCIDRRSAA